MDSLARAAFLASSAIALTGCASVFRDSHVKVFVESDPVGAEVRSDGRLVGRTATEIEMDRTDSTSLSITKPGYDDHRGMVGKRLNPAWTVLDVATCVFPIALCIPLLVDAITGAWLDVDKVYRVKLEPLGPGAPPPAAPPPIDPAAPAPTAPAPTAPEPGTISL